MASRRWRWLLGVAAAYLVALALNRSLARVEGPSMEPVLWPGDRLLTVPAHPRLLSPGTVVVVEDPAGPGHLVVKRIAAIAEGRVDVRGDDPRRSTDSASWGSLPLAAVRRVAVARWPDLRTPLHRQPPAGPDPAKASSTGS